MHRALALLVTFVLVGTGCARDDGRIRVVLDEFSVVAEPPGTRAGSIAFEVFNDGAVAHSLVVLETDLAAGKLPMKDAEVVVDGKRVEQSVATSSNIRPGEQDSLSVVLEVGRYVLFCPVPGHYQSGMYASFEVTGGP